MASDKKAREPVPGFGNETWDGFPIVICGRFEGVIEVKRIITLGLAFVFLIVASVSACSHRLRRPFDGDPDEYQTCQIHDETNAKLTFDGSLSVQPFVKKCEKRKSNRQVTNAVILVIDFSGRISILKR